MISARTGRAMVGSNHTVWRGPRRLGGALAWRFGAWACVRERETGARVSVEKELTACSIHSDTPSALEVDFRRAI